MFLTSKSIAVRLRHNSAFFWTSNATEEVQSSHGSSCWINRRL